MTVAGFVFQHFLAEAIESVLLVNFMEIRFHFVHYWSGEGAFWLVCGEFLKIIFLSLIIAAPFIRFG